MGIALRHDVQLAPLTTLELGGPARSFVVARSEDELHEALALAQRQGLAVFVLGGGSNLVVADAGFDGLVIRLDLRGLEIGSPMHPSVVRAAAGEPWDRVVASALERGLVGLECLSGIPGSTGATPIQNVGAYGREVCELISRVRVLERSSGQILELAPDACEFGYRDSALKRAPDRFIVLAVEFLLHRDESPIIRYPELARALGQVEPSALAVRQTVLSLRRRKSMLLEPTDPNRRSAGSFFTNPIVSPAKARRVVEMALERGLVRHPQEVPCFPTQAGAVKLAAGWLIENSGIAKGLRRGRVGISSRHALALVHHGGGTTRELLDLARWICERVQTCFAIRLVPEPVLLGVRWT